MARIDTRQFTSATIGGITFYVMNGRQYARAKSSLRREDVLKKKAFEKTRQCAEKMGIAAQIGSVIYKALPDDMRGDKWFYRAITGEAASLLYKGKEEQEVMDILWKKYILDTGAKPAGDEYVTPGRYNRHEPTKEVNIKLREVFYERWESQGLSYYRYKHAWLKKRNFDFKPDRFRDELNQAYLERK